MYVWVCGVRERVVGVCDASDSQVRVVSGWDAPIEVQYIPLIP